MTKKEFIKAWIRELPREEVSPGFTNRVMQVVMEEWSRNPYKYQPIISKKSWWLICFMAIIITTLLYSLHSSIPDPSYGTTDDFLGINLSRLFSFFSYYFNKLNSISPAVGVGTLAIIALWFFDQLYSGTVRR